MRQTPQPTFRVSRRSKQSLAIVLVMAIFLTACGATSVPLEAKVTEPAMNANFKVGDQVNISGRASGTNVKKLELHINGSVVAAVDQPARENEFEISIPYQPQQAVTTIILVKGIDANGQAIVTSDPVFVNVQDNPDAAPAAPAAPAAEQPTTAPTQAPEPTTAPNPAAPTSTVVAGDAAAPTPAAGAAPTTAPAAPAGNSVKPSGDFANLRKGPSINYDTVGQLQAGQSLTVKGKNSDGTWYQVAYPGAPEGVAWVFSEVVTFSGDAGKLSVAQAPPEPTAAPQPTAAPAAVVPIQPAAPAAPAATAAPAQPNVPPSALLPYAQSDLFFEPRNSLDWDALKPGEQTAATVTVNGATKLEIQIDGSNPPGIYDCPAGNTGAITPGDAAGKRVSLPVPQPRYPFSISQRGYYVVTIFVTKLDGSTTSIPRGIVVDCYKKPGT